MKSNMVDIIGQLADLKDTDYKNTLAISTLLELLIEKNVFTREEFSHKAGILEKITLKEIIEHRIPHQLSLVKEQNN